MYIHIMDNIYIYVCVYCIQYTYIYIYYIYRIPSPSAAKVRSITESIEVPKVYPTIICRDWEIWESRLDALPFKADLSLGQAFHLQAMMGETLAARPLKNGEVNARRKFRNQTSDKMKQQRWEE